MNARVEFEKHIGMRQVKCATIDKAGEVFDFEEVAKLKDGYTPAEYEAFLKLLEFDYDDGYGGQQLDGIIWYNDGTWSSRGEYDGSEWWMYHEIPRIPASLKRSNTNKQQGGEMKPTDMQKRYENAFLVELAECKTMKEVKELITDTWSPDDIFDDEDLQRWAIRYVDNHVDY